MACACLEGITANPANGDVFVGTFDGGADNKLLRFDRQGRLQASRSFGPTPLLGLAFNPADGKIYIAAVGDFVGTGSRIERVAANLSGPSEVVAQIPAVGAPAPRLVSNPDSTTDTLSFQNAARVSERARLRRRRKSLRIRFVPGRDLPRRECGELRAVHGDDARA